MSTRNRAVLPGRNGPIVDNFGPVVYPTSSEQNAAIVIIIASAAAALVVVMTRVAGRLSVRQFGWDDGLICIAMTFSVLQTAASYMYITTNFIGIPIRDIPPHDPTPGLIWNYAVQILYNPILALVKTSVLLFLLRLFGQKSGVRRFILWLNAANLFNMVATIFAVVFQCFPIEKNWEPRLEGICVDRRILFTANASINILTDLLVLGLPLRIFIGLKIPKRTKIALMFVFLLGFAVTIVGIIRLVLLVIGFFMLIQLPDPTASIGFVTSAIETNLFLITASAPALRPLLRAWFPRLFVGPNGREDVDDAGDKLGRTARRVVNGGLTSMRTANQTEPRLTRVKSTTALRSQSRSPTRASTTEKEDEEAARAFDSIIRQSDIILRYDPRFGAGGLGDGRDRDRNGVVMGRWF